MLLTDPIMQERRSRMAALTLPLCRLLRHPAAERALVLLSMLPDEGGGLIAGEALNGLRKACPEDMAAVEEAIRGDADLLAMVPLCRRFTPGQLLRALALDTAVSPGALEALLTADDAPPPLSNERIRARLMTRLTHRTTETRCL